MLGRIDGFAILSPREKEENENEQVAIGSIGAAACHCHWRRTGYPEKDFDGFAMRKTRHVDGWSLLSYCPGELSREKGALMLKAISPQPEPATAKPVTGT